MWRAQVEQPTAGMLRDAKRNCADKVLVESELFERHVRMLTKGIQSARRAKDAELYQISKDGKVEFLAPMLNGGAQWSDNAINGYANAFHYLRLHGGEPPNQGPGCYGYLSVKLGQLR